MTADFRSTLPWALLFAMTTAGTAAASATTPAPPKHPHHPVRSTAKHIAHATGRVRHIKTRRKPRSAKSIARSRKLQQAFVASSQLRPMAQELTTMRSPAAYAGVTAYAHAHTGEAASAAYLALGHAYLIDHRYPEAAASFQKANELGKTMDDYADFLAAQAFMEAGKLSDAESLLTGFAAKYPESIFVPRLPVMIANLSLEQNDPGTALRVLHQHLSDPIANHADFQLALARANQMTGSVDEAARLYRHIFLTFPLSNEGQQAKTQLAVVGAAAPLTVAERRAHADALYAGGKYADAGEEYRALANDSSSSERNALLVAAAACDFKTKRLSKEEVDSLPDTADESGARRMYLAVEVARNHDDTGSLQTLVTQMEQRFQDSPWLAEALYTSANMYLLRKDYPQAIVYYTELATRFPTHRYAPSSHWKAAWLNYRLGNYSAAAQLFDKQIALYAGGKEMPAALYWRGRLYADQEHQPAMAAAYYQTVSKTFEHYYYAQLSRDRLAELGSVSPAEVAMLDNIQREEIPALTDDVPEDDEHVIKARLLANAGLNEYIPDEIKAADGSEQWGAFAEAEIYSSDGETFRAMRVLKRALPFYTSAPIDTLPMGYWKILFPQQYWGAIEQGSAKNGLDPYMVASLIRQESEFNPAAISGANAWGLMQLLPSVGRSMAKEEGIHHFNEVELLNPETNIRLGTRYLKQTLDKFDGQAAYAFAAYNAGDSRVTDWQSIGKYHGMDEFVESIPFTETRDYVQAILRNESIYRELNGRASPAPASAVAQQKTIAVKQ
ncbi:MAG TPA: transglycosylase SLT domain-containing protein [Acidobacteriaceae bacterium]|nr:transglycosylase SLT domain-containing protein [Acidobacteriaceae bacterium]